MGARPFIVCPSHKGAMAKPPPRVGAWPDFDKTTINWPCGAIRAPKGTEKLCQRSPMCLVRGEVDTPPPMYMCDLLEGFLVIIDVHGAREGLGSPKGVSNNGGALCKALRVLRRGRGVPKPRGFQGYLRIPWPRKMPFSENPECSHGLACPGMDWGSPK